MTVPLYSPSPWRGSPWDPCRCYTTILLLLNTIAPVTASTSTILGHQDCAQNDPHFRGERWERCEDWRVRDCTRASSDLGYTALGQQLLLCHCPKACSSADVCLSNRCVEACEWNGLPNNCGEATGLR